MSLGWRSGLLLLAMAGCYQASVQVRPISAVVELPDGRPRGSSFEIKTRPWPLSAPTVTAQAHGYWELTFPVRWRLGAALGRSREVEVHLVPRHEPSDTWERDE